MLTLMSEFFMIQVAWYSNSSILLSFCHLCLSGIVFDALSLEML